MDKEDLIKILQAVIDVLSTHEQAAEPTAEDKTETVVEIVEPPQQPPVMQPPVVPATTTPIPQLYQPLPTLSQQTQQEIANLQQQLTMQQLSQAGVAGIFNFTPIQLQGTRQ